MWGGVVKEISSSRGRAAPEIRRRCFCRANRENMRAFAKRSAAGVGVCVCGVLSVACVCVLWHAALSVYALVECVYKHILSTHLHALTLTENLHNTVFNYTATGKHPHPHMHTHKHTHTEPYRRMPCIQTGGEDGRRRRLALSSSLGMLARLAYAQHIVYTNVRRMTTIYFRAYCAPIPNSPPRDYMSHIYSIHT